MSESQTVRRPAPTEPPAVVELSPPERRLLVIASLVFAALSTYLSIASRGFLEADGVTHYLYARFAFETPAYFADVWARPVRMLIHAVPAHLFGLQGVRAASLATALACAWITYGIARRLGWHRPALAGFFVLAQPLLFLHSFSELTELPFALLAAVAFHALVSRRWWLFALVCGTMPASRPEGAGFVLLAIAMLIAHRKFAWLPLTLLPTLVWNHMGWHLWGSNAGPWHRWLIDQFPYSSQSLYGSGPPWRFVAVLPAVVSPLILPAILLGTAGVFQRRTDGAADSSPRTRIFGQTLQDAWLIALIPWGILVVHSWLHSTGRMSSSGEPRYLLSAAPFWALLACRGWTMLEARFAIARPVLWAGLVGLVPVAVDLTYPVVPLKPQPDAVLCEQIALWYRASPLAASHPRVYATHPLVYLYTDRPVQDVTAKFVAHPPAGAFFVFDSMYASYNSNPERKVTPAMFEQAGWIEQTTTFTLPTQTWKVYVSPLPATQP